jgi:ketosteroid isomerase-like protein
MSRHSPSRVASWLLAWAVPESNREAVLGDLYEEYALRSIGPGLNGRALVLGTSLLRTKGKTMPMTIRSAVLLLACGLTASCAMPSPDGGAGSNSVLEEIVALERSALDRWITLDPQGYLDLMGPEVTYFDPTTDARVDGLEAMQMRLAPLRNMKLPFKDPRYDMLNPKVQRHGDVALLTFNVVSYGTLPDKPETVLARWNSTEVYARIDGKWKIAHSHWSYVKPEIKQPGI